MQNVSVLNCLSTHLYGAAWPISRRKFPQLAANPRNLSLGVEDKAIG